MALAALYQTGSLGCKNGVRRLNSQAVSDTHAFPLRLIDRVLEVGVDRCTVIKVVTTGEALQDGRCDPGRPYPSSLLVEALAQAALPLVPAALPLARSALLLVPADAPPAPPDVPAPPGLIVAMDGVRIHRPVRAGDRLRISAEITARIGGMIRIRSRAETVGGEGPGSLVAEGEFTIAMGVEEA
jgi:3-hydroxymyristoyl/3-hydroxydecanoyl-(acyl carrier protein) dehydratase